jgi:aspartyl-tRNA synthetase
MTNMHAYRTHNCAELRSSHVGETIRLSGWIHRKREHSNVLFVDLRDHFGLTQIVAASGSDVFNTLDNARAESVVTVEGVVVARDAATVNPNLKTGEIEIHAKAVTVQSAAGFW